LVELNPKLPFSLLWRKHKEIAMKSNLIPPANALRIFSWDQTPNLSKPAIYEVQNEGQEPRRIVVSKNTRRVLEALILSPVYAASYCGISDKVLPLRRDFDIDIECVTYEGGIPTKRARFGVYFLKSKVIRLADQKVAA
jgi:hypothetical protein